MKNVFRSLQARYMFIIVLGISLISLLQVTYILIGVFWVDVIAENGAETDKANVIEKTWHEEADQLQNISQETINQHFEKWKRRYPQASLFWVDETGLLAEQRGVDEELPSRWTPTSTAKFIKDRHDGDPFTVIAFVGKDERNGFIVIEMPRTVLRTPLQHFYAHYGAFLIMSMLTIVILFIGVSFLFFRNIRKRLLQLQEAMDIRDEYALPIQIDIKKEDEVGKLEQTFNQMVGELRDSKQREEEEEQLRKELIATLSHDLRTPLTKISAQTYSLKKEAVTKEMQQTIQTLEGSIQDIDRLIENLMSYTLLMASQYNYNPQKVDVIRFVRESLASWYPVFEKEEFEIDIGLQPLRESRWEVDPVWLGRILDNIFQNVLRHAKDGRYLKVKTESTSHYDAFVIMDHGKGMKHHSHEKGAGVGLSIVNMMIKGMELDWEIDSTEKGTAIKIKKKK